MDFVAGVDGGSTTTKIVVMSETGIVGSHVISTGANSEKASAKILELANILWGINQADLKFLVATGYGRQSFSNADKKITEITCQAKAISYLFPRCQALIDIGGQDFKIIRLNSEGSVEDFCMNNKCAAGTGRFLEVMSRVLELDLDTFSQLALKAQNVVGINSVCTVFAESEVVGQIAKGTATEDLVAGILMAVATRVYSTGQNLLKGCRRIAFTGGGAKNIGLIKALEEKINQPLLVAEQPQITGALGAALFAVELWNKKKSQNNV